MTELLDTPVTMKESKVLERNLTIGPDGNNDEKGGGIPMRGDPHKRRSTEEATSGEFYSKRTKHNISGNARGNKSRRGKKNKNKCGRNPDKKFAVDPNFITVHTNKKGFKHNRRGNKYNKTGTLPQNESKATSQASPGVIVNVATNIPSNHAARRERKETFSSDAPFNSTQFLMSDHGGDTIQYLDSTLGVRQKEANSAASSVRGETRPFRKINRARDSSFSLDSDEDFYYSSPEDEEEFVNQEFIKDYNNVRTDRLVDMSKADLIQEYLLMENRVDSLEKRLNVCNDNPSLDTPPDTSPENNCTTNSEVAEKIRVFQRQILRLEAENERLKHMMQHEGSAPLFDEVNEIDTHAVGEGLIDDVHSNNDSMSSCSTCTKNGSASSSSSSTSSSSRSSTPSIDEHEVENEHFTDSEEIGKEDKPKIDDTENMLSGHVIDTTNTTPVISSNDSINDTELTTEVEDEDKENEEIVQCSEQVSENLVTSTGP